MSDQRASEGLVCAEASADPNEKKTVLITGPPWPRSGTARVMQNQVAYYRSRGYRTVFICVPVHCSFTRSHPDWEPLSRGMQELGADCTLVAPIHKRAFLIGKYTNQVKHAFRGTALDWIVLSAESARIPEAAIDRLESSSVALIHVNHVFTLGFALRLRRQLAQRDNIPILLETHDIQAQRLQERGEINPWTHRPDTMDSLVNSEAEHLKQVKLLVHLSTDDFRFFKELLPDREHLLVLPTIDEEFVSSVRARALSSAVPSESTDLLFVGQNTDFNGASIEWFLEKVWPLLSDRGYRVKIAGAVNLRVRETRPDLYQTFESMFVGHVQDLVEVYRAARCVFAPMVSGTGISIKTIEALALAKPFVGTSKAFRGMPMDQIEMAGLAAHDTPEGFALAIRQALSEAEVAASRSRAAYDLLFSQQASFAARDRSVELAAGR